MPPADTARASSAERLKKNLKITCVVLLSLLGGGLAVAIVTQSGWGHRAVALLWAFACLAVGALAGFLFAIPRVPRTAPGGGTGNPPTAGADSGPVQPTKTSATDEHADGLGVNTNLEEISDWLTKIFVGLGLFELRQLPHFIRRAGVYVAQGMGSNCGAVASGLIIYFFGLGFLSGYLLTRLFLGPTFRLADQATRGLEEAVGEIDALREVDRDVNTAMLELGDPAQEKVHSVGYVEQLIKILENHLRRFPLQRRLNLVLARLYYEGEKRIDKAVEVLVSFIGRKKAANQSDRDLADAYFNLACYYSKMMGAASDDNARKGLEAKALGALEESIQILPKNAEDVTTDPDLDDFRKSTTGKAFLAKHGLANTDHGGSPPS